MLAREAANHNPAWTEESRIIQVSQFAQKHLNTITRTFDSVRSNLVKSITALEQELSRPIQSVASGAIAAEIRAHVKGLPTDKRHAFIRQALDSGDTVTASSVLGAPPYLSGINTEFQQTYTRHWHNMTSPATAKRLRAMQSARAMIEERGALIFAAMDKAVGVTSEKAQKLRAAQSAAEKAFILKQV
jgi:hypothetical protein